MKNYNLNFISNEDLFNHTKETVLKYREPLIINYQEHFSNLSRNFS